MRFGLGELVVELAVLFFGRLWNQLRLRGWVVVVVGDLGLVNWLGSLLNLLVLVRVCEVHRVLFTILRRDALL